MTAPAFVVHGGKRHQVEAEISIDGDPGFELVPLRNGDRIVARRIVARASECREDRRRAKFRGYVKHRGRPVVLDVLQEKGETRIELRQLGRRNGFTMTLEGMFDMAARQAAINERRDRAWKREQRKISAGRAA